MSIGFEIQCIPLSNSLYPDQARRLLADDNGREELIFNKKGMLHVVAFVHYIVQTLLDIMWMTYLICLDPDQAQHSCQV